MGSGLEISFSMHEPQNEDASTSGREFLSLFVKLSTEIFLLLVVGSVPTAPCRELSACGKHVLCFSLSYVLLFVALPHRFSGE